VISEKQGRGRYQRSRGEGDTRGAGEREIPEEQGRGRYQRSRGEGDTRGAIFLGVSAVSDRGISDPVAWMTENVDRLIHGHVDARSSCAVVVVYIVIL